MKILVVEDEIRIREGICNLINKINASYEVVGQATNGREGLELARLHSPDVIITDIMMPELDGISMLKELGEISELPRTIVVSAYSEFSYAQAALRLGVSEYLIKPVTIDELTKALEHLESELSNENNVPESLGSLNNVFTGLINGNLLADEALENYVTNRYGMSHPCKLIEISAYLGYFYDENISEAKINLVQMLEAYGGIEYLMLELPREMSLLIIVYQYDNQDELERWIQNYMRSHPVTMERMCMGMIRVDGLQEIQCNYRLIHSHLDWNMVLGDDVLITFPKVTKLHASSSIYPIEIENKMKVAMCASDTAGTLNEVRRFTEYFFDGKLYSPKDIKEAYTRFIWTALAIAKDMADTEQVNLSQKVLIQKIDSAKSSVEMKDLLEFVFRELLQDVKEEENVGLTVKRTIKLVHEFYRDGITLDEISSKLNITPEYLSAQFQKEMGVNFSSYIRNYRISKAKMLLVGSDMKVYEIASKVGYQDSKYFSRVFRQVTGQKPDEFRKANR